MLGCTHSGNAAYIFRGREEDKERFILTPASFRSWTVCFWVHPQGNGTTQCSGVRFNPVQHAFQWKGVKRAKHIACFLSLLRQTCAPGICGTIRLPIDTFQFSQLSEGLDINNNNRTVYLFFIDLPVLLERLRPTGQRFCLCMVKILKKNPLRKKKEAVKHFSPWNHFLKLYKKSSRKYGKRLNITVICLVTLVSRRVCACVYIGHCLISITYKQSQGKIETTRTLNSGGVLHINIRTQMYFQKVPCYNNSVSIRFQPLCYQ